MWGNMLQFADVVPHAAWSFLKGLLAHPPLSVMQSSHHLLQAKASNPAAAEDPDIIFMPLSD